MKKRIGNNTYDTKVSRPIGPIVNEGKVPCLAWKAGLYRTPKTLKYFLAGFGGLMTAFRGEHCIILLTDKEAMAWANSFLTLGQIKDSI